MGEENKTPGVNTLVMQAPLGHAAAPADAAATPPPVHVAAPQAPVLDPSKDVPGAVQDGHQDTKTPDPTKATPEPAKTPEKAQEAKQEQAQEEKQAQAEKQVPVQGDKQTLGGEVNPNAVVPVDHDNVNVRAVQSLLADAKVTEAEAFKIFGKAVESMNLADIDQALLEEKLGKTNAQLAMAGLQQYYATDLAAKLETKHKVEAAFGNAEGWKAARAFFAAKVQSGDAPTKALMGMLDQGGVAAELAIERMVSMYVTDPNTRSGQLPVNVAKTAADSGFAGKPLTNRVEYVQALKACRTDSERNDVNTRWMQSKAALNLS